MTTQTLDSRHPVQGFVNTWVHALAARLDHLHVIANRVGEHDAIPGVTVHSLGKERGHGRLRKLLRLLTVFDRVTRREPIDGVFVHQVELYGLCVWPLARWRGIPILQFKAHRGIPWTLRLAGGMFDHFVTSTPEGLELEGVSRTVIGQGIDTDRFAPGPVPRRGAFFEVISVGRISPVKGYETMIDAMGCLRRRGELDGIRMRIVGDPATASQREYRDRLVERVTRRGVQDVVRLEGSVAHDRVPGLLSSADLFLNLSRTGSLDKAILEAMACECPVVTSNRAARAILPDPLRSTLCVPDAAPEPVARAMLRMRRRDADERRRLGQTLREIVRRDHSLEHFMDRLVGVVGEVAQGTSGTRPGE